MQVMIDDEINYHSKYEVARLKSYKYLKFKKMSMVVHALAFRCAAVRQNQISSFY